MIRQLQSHPYGNIARDITRGMAMEEEI